MKRIVFAFLLISISLNSQERPNIIMILADDLGAGDLHVTGHPYAKTPNLDKLAKNGVRFEKAYMAAAWCAPSRYGIMSGQYPARKFNRTKNLDPKEPSITSILQDGGYATAHFGKWHLTTRKSTFAKYPYEFGIDEYYLGNWKGEKIKETWPKKEMNKEYWRAKSTDSYVDMAINFIEDNSKKKKKKPFYMNLWIYPTHSYIHPTPEQLAVYDGLKVDLKDFSEHQQEFLKYVSKHGDIDKAMQAYCADITSMDKALGRLFEYLEKEDLMENTVIVFTSDNGPGPLTPQIGTKGLAKRYIDKPDLLNSVGSAKNYKERKISQNEGGIRVPFIVHWPAKIKKGVLDAKSNIQGVDWVPTITSICGVDLPKNGKFDGMDVTSAFIGKGVIRKKPLFWTEKNQAAILIGDKKGYKKPKGFELYDIVKDPSQSTDIASQNPKEAKEMEKLLDAWTSTIKED